MKKYPIVFLLPVALIIIGSTGAFTSISAERTAEIYVAGDDYALLALSP